MRSTATTIKKSEKEKEKNGMNDDTPPAHTPPQRTGKAAPGRSTGKGRRGRSAGARRASEITAAEAEGRAPRQHRASCASVVSKAGGRWKTVKNKMGTRKSDGQCVRFTTSANTKITATTAAKHRGLPHAWLRSESTPRVHSAIEERTEGEASAARGKREASAQQAQQLQKENRKTAESGKRKRTLRGLTGRDTCTHTHANTQTHTRTCATHHPSATATSTKKKNSKKKRNKDCALLAHHESTRATAAAKASEDTGTGGTPSHHSAAHPCDPRSRAECAAGTQVLYSAGTQDDEAVGQE